MFNPRVFLYHGPFQDCTSDVIFCIACFVLLVLLSVSVLFSHSVCLRFRYPSGHLFGKSCSFGYSYVLFVLCLFVIFVVSYFGFDGKTVFLINQFLVNDYLLL